MFALIDCNNFYVSCERLFRPDLRHIPIVVLSNNDGCVISRSNEVKVLGVAMGVPFFQIQVLCRQQGIQVFSSNYALYADMSWRVMSIIAATWPHVEMYSIDEAFLDLSGMQSNACHDFCMALQKKIVKETGIPVSIGIGATKTLAKAANHICKKILKTPVFNLSGSELHWLSQIAVGDIWGIGRRWKDALKEFHMHTGWDLVTCDPHILRRKFNVVLMRTALELRGIACNSIGPATARKSILSSRSFGVMQTELASIAQALSSHCARAVAKLREESLLTQKISVFLYTNRHRKDLAQQNSALEIRLTIPTDDVRVITSQARQCLEKIFTAGYDYKKVGVYLTELMPKTSVQPDLFYTVKAIDIQKTKQFMSLIEAVNHRFGSHTIHLAAQGSKQASWKMRRQLKSPGYTTCWTDLPKVRIG